MFFNIRITIFYHNNLIPSLQAPTCSGYAERKNIRHTKFTNHIIGGEHRVGGFSWSVERCGGIKIPIPRHITHRWAII